MPSRRRVRLAGLLLFASAVAAPAAGIGVVVFEVAPHDDADRAGVRVGDRLVSWSVADEGTPALGPSGSFADPLELDRVRLEHGSRVAVTLLLERDGERRSAVLDPGTWGVAARPDLPGLDAERFDAGLVQVRSDDDGAARAGLAAWHDLAEDWRPTQPRWSFWLDLQRAEAATRRGWLPEAEAAVADARRLAGESGDLRAQALAAERLGLARERASQFGAAQTAFEENLRLRAESDPGSLTLARAWENLGRIAWWQDHLDEAQHADEQALALRTAIAPDGLPVAESYNDLGLVAWNRGDLDTCESDHRRALAIRRRLAPFGLKTAYSLVNLGIVTWKRGALSDAEAAYREALAMYERLRPDSVELARALENLAIVQLDRGRLVEAEALMMRTLDLFRRWGTQRDVAHALTNLGECASARDDREAAAAFFGQALAIKEALGLDVDSVATLFGLADNAETAEQSERWLERARAILESKAPESFQLPEALVRLAELAHARGLESSAQELFAAALSRAERTLSDSWLLGDVLGRAAAADLDAGRQAEAERRLRRALDLDLADVPQAVEEARTRALLARALGARGAVPEALEMMARAETILESNLSDREGTSEERARFRASWADLYLDHVALLVESGRAAEAFEVSERYRARSLAEMLAARDLEFPELPPELARRRQIAETRYRRLLAARRAEPRAASAASRAELIAARGELVEAESEIARAAPRVAELRRVPSLDLAGARRVLGPETVLLSYLVGDRGAWLFALGPGPRELAVHRLATGRDELAGLVRELRGEVGTPSLRSSWLIPAARLGRLLLGPAADRILAARHVLVLADGPLHFLPFAALPVPGPGGGRLLVELRPLQLAASLTVLAEQAAGRQAERPRRLVAFADPAYRVSVSGARPATLAAEVERGLDLGPLPASRREAEIIRDVFPVPASLWLGDQATEERAKAVGRDVSNLHFACHAFVDPRAPLDSGLALASPASSSGEDGLLQVWEIFEQVHLDADLVVLSACDTALGENLPGEGVLGLTRAFQFAGARGVIATQWRVADRASQELSGELYRQLAGGADAAEALRRAQLALARRAATAHPYHWAAFELFGAIR